MRNFSDEEIKALLKESFNKISKGTEFDSKKLNDMNNTLNWVLTLTTFFFIIYNQLKIGLLNTSILSYSFAFKFIFVISIANLIIHKYLLIQYEDFKSVYIRSLDTQYFDFLFNIEKVKPRIEEIIPFQVHRLINKFRDGKLSYHDAREQTISDFNRLDKKINIYGGLIKITFFLGISLFVLEFIFISICIFH